MPTYAISYSISDGDGGKSSVGFYVDAADQPAALAKAETLGVLIDALTLGAITSVTIAVPVDTTSWTIASNPMANSDVEIGGRFLWGADPGDFTMRTTIPAFDKDTLTAGGSSDIDLANAAVAAFVSEVINGGWEDSRSYDIARVKRAYETFGGKG